MADVTYKFPKTMGACADRLYELREKRMAQGKIYDAIEEEEKALKAYIINHLPKGDTGASGKTHNVTVYTKPVPQIKDFDVLIKYVKKNDAFDLFQRRLNETAVSERWEAGKKIPGVEPFDVVTVSLKKI